MNVPSLWKGISFSLINENKIRSKKNKTPLIKSEGSPQRGPQIPILRRPQCEAQVPNARERKSANCKAGANSVAWQRDAVEDFLIGWDWWGRGRELRSCREDGWALATGQGATFSQLWFLLLGLRTLTLSLRLTTRDSLLLNSALSCQ